MHCRECFLKAVGEREGGVKTHRRRGRGKTRCRRRSWGNASRSGPSYTASQTGPARRQGGCLSLSQSFLAPDRSYADHADQVNPFRRQRRTEAHVQDGNTQNNRVCTFDPQYREFSITFSVAVEVNGIRRGRGRIRRRGAVEDVIGRYVDELELLRFGERG